MKKNINVTKKNIIYLITIQDKIDEMEHKIEKLFNTDEFYIIDGDYSFSHSILDMLGIPKEHEEGAKDYNYDKEYETIEEQSKAYGYCRDGDIDVLNEKKLTAEEKYDILTNPSSYKKWWDSVRYRNKK